ncbi:MAG: hypothetical protein F6J94_32985 [Moorea sp. SIO1F2]|uniref:hypothetical protein n=1 Tax=unclassified Moorena TaxID=2683338 RepID=UPI0013BCC3F3|nr:MULTISPECIES: hypothetical protein [unclassified Moorena]NEN96402.1 hypothetical protein [Moorena sp. SIO3I7]NEO05486.1 hypothetical protein [Moorena sp. SIO3I8]NEQ60734.1 hypothetical protein [Moorena sp. SIO4A1]NET86491.1 hypothetical protein [Moorena sp. SIO1F2]
MSLKLLDPVVRYCPIPDSRFPIPDSRFPIPDSRFPIPYSLLPVPCSLFPHHNKKIRSSSG